MFISIHRLLSNTVHTLKCSGNDIVEQFFIIKVAIVEEKWKNNVALLCDA